MAQWKKRKKNSFSWHFFFLLVLLIPNIYFPQKAYAEPEIQGKEIEQKKPKNEVGFTVEPILTDEQIDPSKGYYFIPVVPGEETTLKLNVKSTIKEPRTVNISVEDAYTNQNGQIDYNGTNVKRDKSLKNSLSEITNVSDKEITVKELETKTITITVNSPSKHFDGVKVAAICVTKKDSKNEETGINTSYGYRVGIMITEDKDIDYNNSETLNLLNVIPTVHQGKRVIQSTFQNPEPKILNNLTVETKLRKKGSNEVLRKRTTSDMRMAPNSQFDFATNWGIDPIKPGTYILSIKAASNEKEWTWEREFTIGDKEAKKINEEASLTITYPSWVPVVVILLGIATLVNIGLLYVRRKKWTEQK